MSVIQRDMKHLKEKQKNLEFFSTISRHIQITFIANSQWRARCIKYIKNNKKYKF